MRPKISGLQTPADYLAKAQRELCRYQRAQNATDLLDHATNFAITIDALVEWEWVHALHAHHLWQHFADKDGRPKKEFYEMLVEMEPALHDMATHSRAAKHPILNRSVPSFSASTLTASMRVVMPHSFSIPIVAGAEIIGIAEAAAETGMLYLTYMLRRGASAEEWEPLARATLTFWEAFDPDRGPRRNADSSNI